MYKRARLRFFLGVFTVVVLMIWGAGCTKKGDKEPSKSQSGEYITLPSGVKYLDLVVGEGESPPKGSLVTVHYTGTLMDGTPFDSSEKRAPFSFKIGTGQVISGWDIGVATMKKAGTRELIIPPEHAYGENGAGSLIPPDATLKFKVRLIDFKVD